MQDQSPAFRTMTMMRISIMMIMTVQSLLIVTKWRI